MLLHKLNAPRRQPLPQSKRLENIFQANGPKKQAGVAILLVYVFLIEAIDVKKY